VVHTRYDQLSMIRSMELILGMHPLGLFDGLATPMYDAFSRAPANSEAFTALPEQVDMLARNAPTAANRVLSAGLDRIPQRTLDAVLWKSRHGVAATPPPPGPNADPEKPNANHER
jgi:hypothetical protein